MIYINNPYLKDNTLREHILELINKDRNKNKSPPSDHRKGVLFQVQKSLLTNLFNEPEVKNKQLFLSGEFEGATFLQRYPKLYRLVQDILALNARSADATAQLETVIIQARQDDEHDEMHQKKAVYYWNALKESYPLFKDCDENSMSFALFKEMAERFDVITNLIEKNCVNEEQPYSYAMMALVLLTLPNTEASSPEKVESALVPLAKKLYKFAAIGGYKNTQAYHNLFLVHLQLSNWGELKNLDHWHALIQKEPELNKTILKIIGAAKSIETHCEKEGISIPSSVNELINILSQLRYTRYKEDPSFANLCDAHSVDEATFNQCLDYIQEGPWPRKQDDRLPKESMRYKRVNPETNKTEKEFLWVKMPPSDKRALILGKITDCCQSIGGHSEGCVKDAVSGDHNGLYVLLEKKKEGGPVIRDGEINERDYKIIGQSYAWISELDNLCLDSVECLNNAIADEHLKTLLQSWAHKVLENDPQIRFINVGQGGKTPESWSESLATAIVPEMIKQGSFYGDANQQYVLAAQKPEYEADIQYSKSRMTDQTRAIEYLKYYTEPNMITQFDDFVKENNITWLTPKSIKLFLQIRLRRGLIPISDKSIWEPLLSTQGFDEFLVANYSLIEFNSIIDAINVIVSSEHRKEFFTKIVDRLCESCRLALHFQEIMQLLPSDQKRQFFEKMMNDDKLLPLMTCYYDLRKVMGQDFVNKEMVLRAWLERSIRANIALQDHYREIALLLAAENGCTNIVRELIATGANMDVGEIESLQTPLMKASQNGHAEIVAVLIKAGADINMQDNFYGKTALMWAAQNGHADIVQALIKAGAGIDIQDKSRETALMFAVTNGHVHIFHALIKAGADIKLTNSYTCTLLMRASENGYTEVVHALISHGVDINACDNSKATALMWAAQNGHADIVQSLIKAGANVNLQDNYGWTALMRASKKGYTDIVRALIKAKADINVKNRARPRQCALMLAAANNHTEIIEELLAQTEPSLQQGDVVEALEKNFYVMLPLVAKHTRFESMLTRYKEGYATHEKQNIIANVLDKKDWLPDIRTHNSGIFSEKKSKNKTPNNPNCGKKDC